MRAIDFLKNISILFSLMWLHGHTTVLADIAGNPAETIPTALPQQQSIRSHGCGKGGGSPPPSGMTTVVIPGPPLSPSRPSPAKPTSDTRNDLRRDNNNHLPSPQDGPRPRQAPAAPPVDSNPPPPAPAPPPPVITAGPTLPPGPEYITSDADMKAGVGTYSGIDANGNPFRFVQTTYYSCVTRDATAHCGWHRPIVNIVYGGGGGTSAAAASGRITDIAAKAVGIACFVGVLLVWS
ncbi:hypothetical protein QBC37DRAFT_416051 [Rhypophila decipiens]|uniref:Uncharacterized protein n=1 Tax=Rhypophila decipiens TaxID=261697 RepID=A0AAN6YE39_9PEZI|nr:hypothetical protein QBC37DRAFT_416051 [Rhypophila decipiens]